jgi:hypothetical protein
MPRRLNAGQNHNIKMENKTLENVEKLIYNKTCLKRTLY